ncbi:hypothetical protein BO86DRAFT_34826 [Aspergillus japonicus CBS 114.51]|uniref:Coenzyme Q-binding protein COQ10 START domain-containing protein n=1 Tax=Aspergillus japonicus CBS 114.51 TaxID=1448312 RepID=A0A8T8X728_ASPJA|nr:hypothetical protein BO86DRAFT_34826 [Aspergillus japonicus CBS 114.51]RAH83790.1 hypothetical protein BO86DRAFT_34826 [Aspergillus japonicus CBS 114.51]
MSSSSSSAPILHLTSSIQIHASLDAVWSALTDTTTWPEWNRFVPAVTIREQPAPSPRLPNTTPTPTPAPATSPPTDSSQEPPAAAGAAAAATLQNGTRMTFHVNMHPAAAPTAPQSLRRVDNHVGLLVTECFPPASSSPGEGERGDAGSTVTATATATATTSTATTAPAPAPAPATPPTRRARITWANDTTFQGRVMAALLSAERVHELVEREVVDDSSANTRVVTEVTNWEVQDGYLAYVVKWMFGARLEENFRCWVEDLKGFVEGQPTMA